MVMSIFTIQNQVHFTLINFNIAPSTFLTVIIISFAYLYIIQIKRFPLPSWSASTAIVKNNNHNRDHGYHDRGARRDVRRPPLVERLTAGFRTRKHRDRSPPAASLWLSFPTFGLSQRHGLGGRPKRLGIQRWLQPASLETRGKRQPKQRFLESA